VGGAWSVRHQQKYPDMADFARLRFDLIISAQWANFNKPFGELKGKTRLLVEFFKA